MLKHFTFIQLRLLQKYDLWYFDRLVFGAIEHCTNAWTSTLSIRGIEKIIFTVILKYV